MGPDDCTAFLRWCLPRLELRWAGFRKVRGTVCKRLQRRIRDLHLDGFPAYRAFLEADPEEWRHLETCCRIPISRFYRDRAVFDSLGDRIMPALARAAADRGEDVISMWSAGCASGEEPHSLTLVWRFRAADAFPRLAPRVIGTDADDVMLQRARAACYGPGSLRDLPAGWREAAFDRVGHVFCLRPAFRRGIVLLRQDIRAEMPLGPFDLICCRNLAFTYFAMPLQHRILHELGGRLVDGGILVLGKHESLPADGPTFTNIAHGLPIYAKSRAA